MGTVKMYAKAAPENTTVVHVTAQASYEERGWVAYEDPSEIPTAEAAAPEVTDEPAESKSKSPSKRATPPADLEPESGAPDTKEQG